MEERGFSTLVLLESIVLAIEPVITLYVDHDGVVPNRILVTKKRRERCYALDVVFRQVL
jgi:hypothetical protein